MIPLHEIEPNGDYKEAQRLAAPVVLRGNLAYGAFYDTYRITVDSDRTYTVVITDIADETITDYTPYPHLSFPSFVVEDHLTLRITDSSDDKYFSPEPV